MGEFNNQFRQKFSNIILNKLFKETDKTLQTELAKLVIDNNNLNALESSLDSVILYNAKAYPNNIRIPKNRIPLSESLIPRMDVYITEKTEIDNEYLAISAYLRKLLNTANTLEDIFLLFPTVLNNYLEGHLTEERQFSEKTLSDELIEEFQEETKTTILYVKERILKNFLID